VRSDVRTPKERQQSVRIISSPPKKERRPKPALSISFFDDYVLPLMQVFVESSHFMWAFSQPALVVGTLEAAKPGPAKATANPTATMTERNFFIWISERYVLVAWRNAQPSDAGAVTK
jgi:hypothetical protein